MSHETYLWMQSKALLYLRYSEFGMCVFLKLTSNRRSLRILGAGLERSSRVASESRQLDQTEEICLVLLHSITLQNTMEAMAVLVLSDYLRKVTSEEIKVC